MRLLLLLGLVAVATAVPLNRLNDDECDICKDVIKGLSQALDDPKVQKDIVTELTKLCNYLPENDQYECKGYMAIFVPEVVSYIDQFLPDVCTEILGCPNTQSELVKFNKAINPLSLICGLCDAAVGMVETAITSGETAEAAISDVMKLCIQIPPGNLRDKCNTTVHQYVPILLQLSPVLLNKFCPQLFGCDPKPKGSLQLQQLDNLDCELCADLAKALQQILADPSVESEVKSLLDQVCSAIPGKVGDECKSMVDQYLPEVFQYLESIVPNLCKELGCTQTKAIALPEPEEEAFSLTCVVCDMIVQTLDTPENLDKTAEAMLDDVKAFCGKLKLQTLIVICEQIGGSVVTQVRSLAPFGLPLVCPQLFKCPQKAEFYQMEAVQFDLGCDLCQDAVKALKDVVDDPTVQADVKEALDQICAVLPSSVSTECKNLVAEYLPQAFQAIDQLLPQVCNDLGVCSFFKLMKMIPQPIREDLGCELCHDATNALKQVVDDKDVQTDVQQALDQICAVLPSSISSECKSLVSQYLPQVFQYLDQLLPSVCSDLGVCSGNTNPQVLAKLIPRPLQLDLECELCQDVSNALKQVVDDPSVQGDVKEALDQICAALPSSISDECKSLVNQYLPQVFQALDQLLPTLCSDLGLCSSQTVNFKPEPVQLDLGCDLCNDAVNALKQIVDDKSVQGDVKQALDEICDALPSSVSAECKSLVDQYLPQVFQAIDQLLPGVCKDLGVCSFFKVLNMIPKPIRLDLGCELCQDATNALKQVVDDPSVQGDVKEALDQICDALPSSISAECKSLVGQYLPQVFQYLDQMLPGVCKDLGVCSSSSPNLSILKLIKPLQLDLGCDLCHDATNALKQVVDDPEVQADVKQALDSICDALPSSISSECKTLVGQYLPEVFQLLDQLLPAVCSELGLCSSNFEAKPVQLDLGCGDLCQDAVNALKQVVDDPSVQGDVKTALDQICDALPSSVSAECKSLVGQYLPQVFQAIDQLLPGVCKDLGVCSFFKALKMIPEPIRLDLGCELCHDATNALKQVVDDPSVQGDVKEALDQICDALPSSISAECKSLVGQYLPQVFQYLDQLLPGVCKDLGVCSSSGPNFAFLKLIKPLKLDLGCELCQDATNALKQVVDDPSVQADVKEALDQICDALPSSISAECKSLVNEYLPQAFQAIDQLLPGVCKDLGLCSSFHAKQSTQLSIECDLCEDVVKGVMEVIDDPKVQTDIRNALDQVCDVLPNEWKYVCKNAVYSYLELIIQQIDQVLPNVCQGMMGCGANYTHPFSLVQFDLDCELCTDLQNALKQVLDDAGVRKDIEDGLDEICDALPSSVRDECKNLVSQYLPQVYQLLDQLVAGLCTDLKLCPSTLHTVSKRSVKSFECTVCNTIIGVLKAFILDKNTVNAITSEVDKICQVLPGDLKQTCEALVKQYIPKLLGYVNDALDNACPDLLGCPKQELAKEPETLHVDPQEFSLSCDVCEAVVDIMKAILSDKDIQTQLKQVLDGACNDMPKELQSVCKDLVNEYLPQIITYVEGELDKACSDLFQCESAQKSSASKFLTHVSLRSFVKQTRFSIGCDVCEGALDVLRYFLQNQAIQDELEVFLDKGCGLIPDKALADACKETVNNYLPEIMDYIIKDVLSDQLCQKILNCGSTSLTAPDFSICDTLEEIYKKIPEIIDEAEGVCDKIPVTELKQACHQAFKEYKAQIVQIGQDAVKWLGDHIPFVHCNIGPTQNFAAKPSVGCKACDAAMEVLKYLLKQPLAQSQLEKVIAMACNVIPDKALADACKQTVAEYSKELFDYVDNNVLNKKICAEILGCSSTKMVNGFAEKENIICSLLEAIYKSAAEIIGALEPICNVIPDKKLSDDCKQTFEEYAPILVEMIQQVLQFVSDVIPFVHCKLGNELAIDYNRQTSIEQLNSITDFLCGTFQDLYHHAPLIFDDIETTICGKIPYPDLRKPCKDLFDAEKPNLIAAIQSLLKKIVAAIPFLKDCQLGPW